MQFCNYCQVKIRGNRSKCQLCGNTLPESIISEEQEEICPKIPPDYERHLAIRIMLFISIVTVVVNFAIYIIFRTNINWPVYVVFGLLSMWLSLIMVIWKRHNISKNIMWQVTIVSTLSILWDWRIGWRGWSLDYVTPIACIAAMVVMYVTAKIMRLSVRDYIIYSFLDGLFGIIPILFFLLGWINVFYPSIICVGISIIFLSAIFIFHGENIKMELDKRMHI